MGKKPGSEGLNRKTTAEWAADTNTYLEGERLMDTDTGVVRTSSGGTYAQAWVPASGGGSAAWGAVTGTLSDQTDLQAALNSEASTRSLADVALNNAKVDKTTQVNGHALSGNVNVTASDVGLGNVDDTADADKPVSTATQTALDLKADITSLAKVYRAVVSNAGAIQTTVANQLGVTFTWSHPGGGQMQVTADSGTPFTAMKTMAWAMPTSGGGGGTLCDTDAGADTTVINFFFFDPLTGNATDPPGNWQAFIEVHP